LPSGSASTAPIWNAEPMQRAAETALAPYGKAELVLLLDFFTACRAHRSPR
jgi:hypothetical protein